MPFFVKLLAVSISKLLAMSSPFTSAASSQPTYYKERSKVYGVCGDPSSVSTLPDGFNIELDYDICAII